MQIHSSGQALAAVEAITAVAVMHCEAVWLVPWHTVCQDRLCQQRSEPCMLAWDGAMGWGDGYGAHQIRRQE